MTPSQHTPSNGIATIALSSRILVQGSFVRKLDESRIIVRVGAKDYSGHQVSQIA